MSPSLAWFLMESPTLWLTFLLFPFGQHFSNPKSVHFDVSIPLSLLQPYSLLPSSPVKEQQPRLGFFRWVSHYKNDYENDKLFWWRFLGGLLIFIIGMWVNIWADKVLVGLKNRGGGSGYKIPRGGLFDMVSCPNYFGEIMEWFSWAVMTWSWVGFGFFLCTCANLVPRARASRRWYLEKEVQGGLSQGQKSCDSISVLKVPTSQPSYHNINKGELDASQRKKRKSVFEDLIQCCSFKWFDFD
ncbi:hypothetical protein CRYUN_Cryun09bG0011300 [Craigia yunnanensis]